MLMYKFCNKKSLELACLLLLAILSFAKCQDPEKVLIRVLQGFKEFEAISMVSFSGEERKMVAKKVKENTTISPVDIHNIDFAICFTYPHPSVDHIRIWKRGDTLWDEEIHSPEGSQVVTDQVYFGKNKNYVHAVCAEKMRNMAEVIRGHLDGILKAKKANALSIGVEPTPLRVNDKILLYTVMFFEAYQKAVA